MAEVLEQKARSPKVQGSLPPNNLEFGLLCFISLILTSKIFQTLNPN
jgi:hypothetical protein